MMSPISLCSCVRVFQCVLKKISEGELPIRHFRIIANWNSCRVLFLLKLYVFYIGVKLKMYGFGHRDVLSPQEEPPLQVQYFIN